jgi:ATP-dependent RNA helicase DDX52/ROK1
MDVFKLLSRSAKAPQASTVQKLPSSGAVANPQLFGNEDTKRGNETSKKSKKRKRGEDTIDSVAELPSEIDFFGATSAESKTQRKEKKNKLKQAETDAQSNGAPGKVVPQGQLDSHTDTYDEDECKRVLRAHKLKITVLEDFAPSEPAETQKGKKKSKKKQKRVEEEQEKAKKKDKRQLYPVPLTSFAQLRTEYGISRRLAENIQEQGCKLPTEVQLGALPLLLGNKNGSDTKHNKSQKANSASGRGIPRDIDLLTIAPTGSGKTIAFLVPIINSFLSENHAEDTAAGPRTVILAPTRELASQIVNEARKLAKGTGIKASLMRKGMEVMDRPEDEEEIEEVEGSDSGEESSADEKSLSDGSETKEVQKPRRKKRKAELVKSQILVSTPLALLNALRFGDEVLPLPSVDRLVLDEADVLLDPLFRDQTLSIWNACNSTRLCVGLWSATMGSNIETLALSTLNDRWASLDADASISRPPLIRLVVGLKDTAIPNINHKLTYAATEQGKLLGLRQLLSPTHVPSSSSEVTLRPPFLVFTQTIPRAIALHSELLYDIPSSAGGSSRIAVLHANLSSSARESIMTRFRKGEVWILITTDLLARGVDFRGLNGVVNYDVPNSAAAYVHRVGRTGRAGREGGVAVTFYTEEDIPYIKQIANVIKSSENQRGEGGENAGVQQWLLDALPTPTKRDKQQLKKRGVEARRTARGKDEQGKGRARISTKSGYERRLENNRRGAKTGTATREQQERRVVAHASESEFEGFE